MKIAFDVDVLAKQMPIRDMVYNVADWGYKYIEQSSHPRTSTPCSPRSARRNHARS